MRFEHLAVRTAEEELGMAFHQRLTIVSGLGHAERREMVELLLNSLVGGRREGSSLRYVDGTGRIVLVEANEGTVNFTFEDGSPAPDPSRPSASTWPPCAASATSRAPTWTVCPPPTGGPVPPRAPRTPEHAV